MSGKKGAGEGKKKVVMNFVNLNKTKAVFGCGNQQELLFVKQELIGILFGCGFQSEIFDCLLPSHTYLAPPPLYFSSHCAGIHQISILYLPFSKIITFFWMLRV